MPRLQDGGYGDSVSGLDRDGALRSYRTLGTQARAFIVSDRTLGTQARAFIVSYRTLGTQARASSFA